VDLKIEPMSPVTQLGRITFRGRTRIGMRPHEAGRSGIAHTFQNVTLFRGMSLLDNIMPGCTLRRFFWQMLRVRPGVRWSARRSSSSSPSSRTALPACGKSAKWPFPY
jgi:ABC-type branched-subunit amino acid transport system ATPase component